MRSVATGLAVTLASLVVLALVFEVLVRLFTETPVPIRVPDLEIGGRHRRGLEASIYVPESGRIIELRFNSEGFRSPEWRRAKDAGRTRIALIGDSQISAIATPEEKTLAMRLEAKLSATGAVEVMNFGVSGASTAQEMILYRKLIVDYEPDVVVLVLYAGNDFSDNLEELSTAKRIYLELDDAGELQERPPRWKPDPVKDWFNENSRFYVWQKQIFSRAVKNAENMTGRLPNDLLVHTTADRPVLRRGWKLMQAVLRTFRREVEAAGQRFLLVVIPDPRRLRDDIWEKYSAEFPDLERTHAERRLRAIASAEGIEALFLSERFTASLADASSSTRSVFYGDYGHINETGQTLAADEIAARLALPATPAKSDASIAP
jgi:lysophospholipase L1-like esterase